MKKILGITSSAQKNNGETEKSLDFSLDIFEKNGFRIKKFILSHLNISFCSSCNFCKENPSQCSIKDQVKEILDEMKDADALIFASPVYFGSVSAQLKALFDRTLPIRRDNLALRDKICSGITVGRSRNGGQEFVLAQIQAFANIHGMIYVGDDNHFGGTVTGNLETDDFGKGTIKGLSEKIIRILS